jgi:hypothetical protein
MAALSMAACEWLFPGVVDEGANDGGSTSGSGSGSGDGSGSSSGDGTGSSSGTGDSSGGSSSGGPDGSSGSSSGGPFCASLSPQPVFCDDFDTYPLTHFWNPAMYNGAQVGLSTTPHVSSPNSLSVMLPALTGGPATTGAAFTNTQFTNLVSLPFAGTIAFDVYLQSVDQQTESANPVLMSFTFGSTQPSWTLQVPAIPNGTVANLTLAEGAVYADGGSAPYHPAPQGPPLSTNAWYSVVVTVNVGNPTQPAGNNSATLTVYPSGSDAGSAPITLQMQYPIAPAAPNLGIGCIYQRSPSTVWQVYFDNVVFDVKPQ